MDENERRTMKRNVPQVLRVERLDIVVQRRESEILFREANNYGSHYAWEPDKSSVVPQSLVPKGFGCRTLLGLFTQPIQSGHIKTSPWALLIFWLLLAACAGKEQTYVPGRFRTVSRSWIT